ncbi:MULTISPECIES: NAD(P)/FAD-dependent oxidoreductase [Actinoalloteichus]|uniref:NADH dehydrogenase, FAD-containing subunit n=1 Tax=Actinoalloteichus fjordicus TaxID=1612552 RepID=A0AAC9L8Q1_9PSEU|nr:MULTISPECIES: FAD-dependent oxidoreductase [Actinoalloteichus]APU13458.1 NADH dehydrogenase, FAD-containing subunit [Actinoalloteichus fjordicus]APU19407.1 NADH dehydrogenase, FAD-containing subunit [Actinoalloteichus sp. GBA129-24]
MKIVVIGAGYSGTAAANRLAKKLPKAEVTVINPRPDFVERVRLHQRVAGTAAAATPLTTMLRTGITSLVGAVDKVGAGSVTLDDGRSLDYDYAVLAVGSTVQPLPGTVPVGTWEGAERAREALATLGAGSTVAVVGGGPTGIETAAEIAAARPDLRVRLVGSSVAGSFSPGPQARVRAGLERLTVEIVDDEVTKVTDGVVHLRSGETFAADLTLWAIVSGVPDLAARSGLAVDESGRAIVDESLRSVTDERILVVGDCAAATGGRMACQVAGPQGAHAADTVALLAGGRAPAPYSARYLGRGVSLGRKDAVGQFTRRDDTLLRAYVAGGPAVVIKEMGTRGAKFSARAGIGS